MKKLFAVLSIVVLICITLSCLISCTNEKTDYVSQLHLDMTTNTAKQEVTVKLFVDGDTTHFNVPTTLVEDGVLKARYLAIDTPESTGKIENYGKTASKFTRSKLEGAESIIIESDDGKWNVDSTGSRYLVWVWYKPAGATEYRNLNLEILQEGLAIASNVEGNRYGEICGKALNQAKQLGLYVFSGQEDPEMYHGKAQELTIKELRLNVKSYEGTKVAFEGVITNMGNNSIYIEDYDEETGLYFGMTAYLGFGLSSGGLRILSVGNRARIVGTVQYYEAGDSYQVSGLEYKAFPDPDNPDVIRLISKDNPPAYVETSPSQFANGKVKLAINDEEKSFDYAQLALYTTVSMKNLTVERVYTTESDTSSDGAMTLTCKAADGTKITVRTIVFTNNGELVTAAEFEGKTIDVKGFVDYYSKSYQIKVMSYDDITIR